MCIYIYINEDNQELATTGRSRGCLCPSTLSHWRLSTLQRAKTRREAETSFFQHALTSCSIEISTPKHQGVSGMAGLEFVH